MARADTDKIDRMLNRVGGYRGVRTVRGQPDAVVVSAEPDSLRAIKSRLMREGYVRQPRHPEESEGEYVFRLSGGSRRRNRPPRNREELTEAIRGGEGWL